MSTEISGPLLSVYYYKTHRQTWSINSGLEVGGDCFINKSPPPADITQSHPEHSMESKARLVCGLLLLLSLAMVSLLTNISRLLTLVLFQLVDGGLIFYWLLWSPHPSDSSLYVTGLVMALVCLGRTFTDIVSIARQYYSPGILIRNSSKSPL